MGKRGRQMMDEMKRRRHEDNVKKRRMPKFVKPKWKPICETGSGWIGRISHELYNRDGNGQSSKEEARELNSLEIMNVESEQGDDEFMEVTVDSGATDSVMDRSKGRCCPVRPSEGSRRGVNYVAAAGKVIPNEGEKRLRVITEEGHGCNLNMQITAVNKALLSVSKMCDAGHEVKFTKAGGTITHMTSGQVTNFNRVDGVYRIRLKIVGESNSNFTRQGK